MFSNIPSLISHSPVFPLPLPSLLPWTSEFAPPSTQRCQAVRAGAALSLHLPPSSPFLPLSAPLSFSTQLSYALKGGTRGEREESGEGAKGEEEESFETPTFPLFTNIAPGIASE